MDPNNDQTNQQPVDPAAAPAPADMPAADLNMPAPADPAPEAPVEDPNAAPAEQPSEPENPQQFGSF